MAVEVYFAWGQSSASVAAGETVAVPVTADIAPSVDKLSALFSPYAAVDSATTSVVVIRGVSAGSITVPTGRDVAPQSMMDMTTYPSFTLTVTAPVDDDKFLNKRGLTHFWENISSAISTKISTGDVQTTDIVNGAVTTAKLADDAVGWKYLGCVHTETATNQLDFTLPAQYDNYKIIASSVISTDATNGAWQTLSPLNGSSLLNFSGFLEKVEGTSWSCEALTSKDYVSQNTTYPYFSVFHEVLSMRSMSSETRHYMTTSVSGGGSTNGRTTRGNFHGVVSTEPTGFRLRMASNYIRSGSIYVWGMNNPT